MKSRLSLKLRQGVKEMARKIRGRNEGSFSKRPGGSWRVQISMNGTRLSHSAKSKAECQAWVREIHSQLDQGYNLQDGRITIGEYLTKWLETHKATLRLKTSHQYEQIIRNHINPQIGAVSLQDLRLARVEQLYADLIASGIGVRTVRLTHSVLHRALEKAVKYGSIIRNPSHGAALPRLRQAEMQVLDENEANQFLVAAQGSPYEALYHLAITTGMRESELFGLKWSDLKWHSGALHIQRQVQRVDGHGWGFVEPKTKAGKRSIVLSEGNLQALRQHKERQEQQRAIAGERWNDLDLIFPNSVGMPLDPSNMRLDFNRTLKKASLKKVRFHDLRHTAASLMLNHGVPVIVVSKRLGHAKPSITLDVYGHLYLEMQGEAARIMDELINPIQIELPKRSEIQNQR
jgi:integrase